MMYEVTVHTPTMSATLRGENRDDLFALVKKIEELVAEPAPALPPIDGATPQEPAWNGGDLDDCPTPQEPAWIAWNGGDIDDCPTQPGADVEVRFRDGDVERDKSPETWRWNHVGFNSDIVAYRVWSK